MGCCDDLKALLAPLGLYDLSAGTRNEAELFALGGALDGVDAALETAEREALVSTAVGEGLTLREALLPWRPAAETLAERRAAIRALHGIDGDSLTLAAVNRAIQLRYPGPGPGDRRGDGGGLVSGAEGRAGAV